LFFSFFKKKEKQNQMATRKASKKAASAKNKENKEKTSDEEGVDFISCPCKDCHASIEFLECHGDNSCFNPMQPFEEKIKYVEHPNNLCSAYCCLVAKTRFNVVLSVANIVSQFYSIRAEKFDAEKSFLELSLLKDAAKHRSDAKIEGQFVPNYIVNNLSEDHKYIAFIAMYAGFNYEFYDYGLLEFVAKIMSRKRGVKGNADVLDNFGWLERFLRGDKVFREKISDLFLFAATSYPLGGEPEEKQQEDEDSEDEDSEDS
jgi:hypothetical protein